MLRTVHSRTTSLCLLTLLVGACSRSGIDLLGESSPVYETLPDGAVVEIFPDGGVVELEDAGPDASSSDSGKDSGRDARTDGSSGGGDGSPNPLGEAGPPPVPLDVCGMTVFQVGAAWPTYQRCPFHRGATDVRGPTNPAVKWQVSSPMGIQFGWPYNYFGGAPVIAADGTIYLTLVDGAVTAISPQGTTLWTAGLASSGWYGGSPSVSVLRDGSIYVALDKLYLITPGGGIAWSMSFTDGSVEDTSMSISPTVGIDGTIFAGGWRSQTTEASGLFAARARAGLWHNPSLDLIGAPTVGSDGNLYVIDSHGLFVSYDSMGNERWNEHIGFQGAEARMTPTVGPDGTVYVGASVASSTTSIYAMTPDGSTKWSVLLPRAQADLSGSGALAPDGTLYVIDGDATLRAIDGAGSLKWAVATSGELATSVENAPIVDGAGTVYFITTTVTSSASTLYAVSPSGNVLWHMDLGGFANSPPAIGSDGTLYVATSAALLAIGNK